VALVRRNELLCGAVYDPVSRECFTAQAGGGAQLNGQPLAVSSVERLDQAVIAVSLPPRVQPNSREIAEMVRVTLESQAIRRTGSAALNLCYLAAGRFDAYWGGNTKPWDVAAGALMIREAGGVITDYQGGPLDLDIAQFVAAATPALHEQLLRLVGDER
jgi:myo-inositol-1(or 4)-monophosphatase